MHYLFALISRCYYSGDVLIREEVALSFRRSFMAMSIAVSSVIALTAARAGETVPRVVSCDEVVQSQKRGVCENHLDAKDFEALSPGVSWYYNWNFKTDDVADPSLKMTFIPMVWGDNADSLTGLQDYLQSAVTKPPVILAINEPNLKGQAFITPEATADLYRRTQQAVSIYNIPVVGPNMALGTGADQSIKAFDPIENQEVTYTFMIPFIKAFLNFAKIDNLSGAGIHTYGSIGEMKWAVDTIHKACNWPIWVTEYAYWNAKDANQERDYMIQATDFLERSDYVKGYAWFKERADNNHNLDLLSAEPGTLTELGKCYVNLPVHDKSLYYSIPGNLSAGKYAFIDKADISSSPDGAILIDSKAPDSTVSYNVYVNSPGAYDIAVDFSGTGKITVSEKGAELGSFTGTKSDIQTETSSVQLDKGYHNLVVQFDSGGLLLNTIHFTKRG